MLSRIPIALVVLTALLPWAPADAAPSQRIGSTEIALGAGLVLFDEADNLENDVLLALRVGHNFTLRTALELSATGVPAHRDEIDAGDRLTRSTTYALDALLHLTPRKRVAAYLSAGGGTRLSTPPTAPAGVDPTQTTLFGPGAGAKLWLTEQAGIRLDVKWRWTPSNERRTPGRKFYESYFVTLGPCWQIGGEAPPPEYVASPAPPPVEPTDEPPPAPAPAPVPAPAPIAAPEPTREPDPAPTPAPPAPEPAKPELKPVAPPQLTAADVAGKPVLVVEDIHFETARASLKAESKATLADLAKTLEAHAGLELVEIQGHTDERGAREYSVNLSRKRARAVRDHLVKLGVSRKRLTAEGYGPDRPIHRNARTPEQHSTNRRVNFVIIRMGATVPKVLYKDVTR